MKRMHSFAILLASFTLVIASCKKDEVAPPVPVDGLSAVSGFNRALVEFIVPQDAKTGKVFYGTGNFEEFTVTDASAVQSIIVEGLKEEEQFLRVVTTNEKGETSDPRAVKVRIYGTNYQATLTPRKWLNQINNSANSIELLFEEALTNEVGVRILFTNTNGVADSVLMSRGATSIAINNIDTSKASYYYSAYKPYIEAIDEFKTTSIDLKEALTFNFVKESWTIASSSSEVNGKEATMLIDNDIATTWQSETGNAFPHWVVINMGSAKTIDGFYYVNAQNGGNAVRKLRIELSNDGTTWNPGVEVDVADSYLRQRLALDQTKQATFLRITALSSWNNAATFAQIGEIDAYNLQNVSGQNGIDNYINTTPVSLINAKAPFASDGSDRFSPVGANRMQRVTGWTHNVAAYISYDTYDPSSITFFIAPVWGLSEVHNGKMYQTVTLQPGKYSLKTRTGNVDGPVTAYTVVTTGADIPDYANVPNDAGTVKHIDLATNANKTIETVFEVTTTTTVKIGVVYSILDQYSSHGTPWSSLAIKEVNLIKVP